MKQCQFCNATFTSEDAYQIHLGIGAPAFHACNDATEMQQKGMTQNQAGARTIDESLVERYDNWAYLRSEEQEPPDLVVEQMNRIEAPGYNELGEDDPYYSHPDDEEEYISGEGDGSGLHQCDYCYDQVSDGHEEFCRLNPNRNRNIVP